MLGAAITLPMILVSGPIAGYVLSRYLLIRFFNAPNALVPIFILLGFLASGVQAWQLIQKIKELDSKQS